MGIDAAGMTMGSKSSWNDGRNMPTATANRNGLNFGNITALSDTRDSLTK